LGQRRIGCRVSVIVGFPAHPRSRTIMIPRHRLPRPLAAFLFALFALAAPFAAHAQIVQGRVVDEVTCRRPHPL
jgi:hypothetical protein